jgi:hypothetical protein
LIALVFVGDIEMREAWAARLYRTAGSWALGTGRVALAFSRTVGSPGWLCLAPDGGRGEGPTWLQ